MGGRKRNLYSAQAARSRTWPAGRRRAISRCSLGLFRDWRRTQTQSSVTALGPDTANGCPVLQRQDVRFCNGRNHSREAQCELVVPRHRYCALLKKRASRDVCFLLTNDLHGRRPLRRKVHLDYSLLHINWLFDAPSAGCGSGAQWAAIVVVGHPEKAVAKVT